MAELNYPSTNNFFVKDTFPEKHIYCITPKHLEYSSGMYLDIEGAEKKGAVCDICKKANRKDSSYEIMTLEEHRNGLIIGCKIDIQKKENREELIKYLSSIKAQVEKENYIGFAFMEVKR